MGINHGETTGIAKVAIATNSNRRVDDVGKCGKTGL